MLNGKEEKCRIGDRKIGKYVKILSAFLRKGEKDIMLK